jgi:hypothetical protein
MTIMNERPMGQAQAVDEKSRGALWRALDKIEECLLKMIFGIFKFTFYRLPRFVWETIESWFPTILKIARVLILICIWLSLLIGPLAFIYYKLYGIRPHPIDIEAEIRVILEVYGTWSLAWAGLALIGSFWGLVYVRRETWNWWRRRQETRSRPWEERNAK